MRQNEDAKREFAELVTTSFFFLVSDYGYSPPVLEDDFVIVYSSKRVRVEISWYVGLQLQVEFGLVPRERSRGGLLRRLTRGTPLPAPSKADVNFLSFRAAAPALIQADALSDTVRRELLFFQEYDKAVLPRISDDELEAQLDGRLWPVFACVDSVCLRRALAFISSVSKTYLSQLLHGQEDIFTMVAQYDQTVTHEYSRQMHLRWLPTSEAKRLRDAPLAEIIEARRRLEGW